MSIHRRAGLERHDMADRTSSEYASDKAWNSLLLMPATSSPTGMCSFLLNLAQNAVIFMHHHGRCGVSGSAVQKRSPKPRRCPRAANRQANGGGERDHTLGFRQFIFCKLHSQHYHTYPIVSIPAQGLYQLICTIRTNDNELTVQCNTSPAVSRTPLNRYCQ